MGEGKRDFTRGGRFINPAPDSFYDDDGMSYWENMNRFVDYVDDALPSGFALVNTSAYRKDKVLDKNFLLGRYRSISNYCLVNMSSDHFLP